jgi:hypothetical protein
MKNFSSGQYVVFISEFYHNVVREGYLLKKAYPNEPVVYWAITTDSEYKELIINQLDKMSDTDFIEDDKVVIVKEELVKVYSNKQIDKFSRINKFLENSFLRNNVDVENERLKWFCKNNNKLLISLKAFCHFICNPIMIFVNVILIGLIKLAFGGLLDYFCHLCKIYEIKQKIKEAKVRAHLIKRLDKFYGNPPDQEKGTLENELKELEEKTFNIYNTLVAIIIAVISLVVSMSKQ